MPGIILIRCSQRPSPHGDTAQNKYLRMDREIHISTRYTRNKRPDLVSRSSGSNVFLLSVKLLSVTISLSEPDSGRTRFIFFSEVRLEMGSIVLVSGDAWRVLFLYKMSCVMLWLNDSCLETFGWRLRTCWGELLIKPHNNNCTVDVWVGGNYY